MSDALVALFVRRGTRDEVHLYNCARVRTVLTASGFIREAERSMRIPTGI